MVSVTTGSLTTFRAAWNGVDLLNVNLEVERGTVLVDDATDAAEFIDSDEGVQWLRAPFEIRHEVAEIIRALSPHTLRGSRTRVGLNVSGSCLELEMSTEYFERLCQFRVGYYLRKFHSSLGKPFMGTLRQARRSRDFENSTANTRCRQHSSRSPAWGPRNFALSKLSRNTYTTIFAFVQINL